MRMDSELTGKGGRGKQAKRSLAVLLSVLLAAGMCLPAWAAEPAPEAADSFTEEEEAEAPAEETGEAGPETEEPAAEAAEEEAEEEEPGSLPGEAEEEAAEEGSGEDLDAEEAEEEEPVLLRSTGGNDTEEDILEPDPETTSAWLSDYGFEVGNDRIILVDYMGSDTDITVPSQAVVDGTSYSKIQISPRMWGEEVETLSFERGVVFPSDSSFMFEYMSGLKEADLSAVDTSDVTEMDFMFSGCVNLASLNMSGFDTSKVTNMSYMFHDCSALTDLDVSGFTTSGVTDMGSMFSNCGLLTELDVRSFDTSKVTNMESMFAFCGRLTSLDVSRFRTSEVTDMNFMFDGCAGLQELDVRGFDTSRVQEMCGMFSFCRDLTSLDVSGFETAGVTDFGGMFTYCTSLTSLDLSGFDMSAAENADEMLLGSRALKTIQAPLHVSRDITLDAPYSDGSGIFYSVLPHDLDQSILLTRAEASEWLNDYQYSVEGDILTLTAYLGEDENVTVPGTAVVDGKQYDRILLGKSLWWGASVVSLSFERGAVLPADSEILFGNMNSLTSLDLSRADTSDVTDMDGMFEDCVHLRDLDLSGIDTSNVTSMSCMFDNCKELTDLDVSGFRTSKVTDMSAMFRNCQALTSLDLSGFDLSSLSAAEVMLEGCISLNSIHAPLHAATDIALDVPFTDSNGMLYTALPQGLVQSVLLARVEASEWLNDYSYSVQGDTLTLLAYYGNEENVTIPGTALAGGKTFSRIVMSDGLVIESASLTLGDGVILPADSSYLFCYRDYISLDIREADTSNVTKMNSMFEGNFSLKSLNLGGLDISNVTEMNSMIKSCSSLTEVRLPEGAAFIDEEEFSGCYHLERVYIPAGVTEIRDNAFSECEGLTDIYFGGTEEEWNRITVSAEGNDALSSVTVHYGYVPREKGIGIMGVPAELETGAKAVLEAVWYGDCGMPAEAPDGIVWQIVSGAGTGEAGLETISNEFGSYQCEVTGISAGTVSVTAVSGDGLAAAAEFRVTEEGTEKDPAVMRSASASFEGKIGVNFYLMLPDWILEDPGAYVRLTHGEDALDIPVSEASVRTSGGETWYGFTYQVAAAEIRDTINMRIFDGDGRAITLKNRAGTNDYTETGVNYALITYANRLLTSSNPKEAALAQALIDYGTAAEIFFRGSSEGTISGAVGAVAAADLDPYKGVFEGTYPEGMAGRSISALFESDNTLRLYYRFGDGADPASYAYAVDGTGAQAGSSDSGWYLEVANVPAPELDTAHAFTISKGGVTYTVRASVLTYARSSVMNGTEARQDLGKALYLYNQAAKAYFG